MRLPRDPAGRAIAGRIPLNRALGVGSLIGAGIFTLPRAGYPLTPYAENEYQAAMVVALEHHLQWGSQVVWTYGPLGYLNEPAFLDFNSWVVAFLANLFGHLALVGLLAFFLWRIGARPWFYVLVSAVILLTFDRYTGEEFQRFAVLDQKAAVIVVLLLFCASESDRQKLGAGLAGAAGLLIGYLFLDKGTFMAAGAGVMAVFVLLSLGRGRIGSSAAVLAGAITGFIVLWLLAGQSIAGIPAYFRTFFEILVGYAPAMSLYMDSGAQNPDLQWEIALAMLGLTGLVALIAVWRRNWSLVRLLLMISPVMFLVFKNAFVRFNEAHVVEFSALVAVLETLVLARVFAGSASAKRKWPVLAAGLTLVTSVALVSGLAPLIGGIPDMRPSLPFPTNLASYPHAGSLLLRPERRQQEEAQVRANLQAAYPLPQAVLAKLSHQTVDCVPLDLQMCLAYDFNWDPQPVLQSYNAWRPYLDHLNALHYLGPNAPRYVLFAAKDIDGRYPLFDEPETYRVLMDRYQLIDRVSFVLVLERRGGAEQSAQQDAGEITGRINDWIRVPAHGDLRLYGRLKVTYSLLGQALTVLHRPPELHVLFRYGGGRVSPVFRFVPAVAEDGLDLSSYAADTDLVGLLAEGQFVQPIEAVKILTESPSEAYDHEVRIEYFTQPVK